MSRNLGSLPDPLGARMRLFAFVALVGIVFARSWLSDDAFITLRTVDNLVHGFGARWNVADRVQTYTHPLWMMLLAIPYAATREPYFTTVVLNWLLTGAACAILAFRIAATPAAGTLVVTILALSAAFTDYATGGLENPLTHAMLALFFLAVFARGDSAPRVFQVTLVASLIALSRPDAVLLIVPAMLVIMMSARGARKWVRFGLGLLPLLGWGAFAVTYYGFPWPNTAYAKLGTGIPSGELALQGARYLLESLRNDPLALVATTVSLVLAIRRGDAMERALAAGIALYILWVIKIGGDFMSGRFLTAPLFVAAAILARRHLVSRRAATALLVGTIVVGASSPHAVWRVFPPEGVPPVDVHGIADERAFYLDATGLAARLRSGRDIDYGARFDAIRAREAGPAVIRLSTKGCGMFGYFAGPGIHIVDDWALGDPLLARLPAERRLHWRSGHFARVVPEGYLETLRTGHNTLHDPNLARYWDRLAVVVRAPLFSRERWEAIMDFARGRPATLIDHDRWRLPSLVEVDAAQFETGMAPGPKDAAAPFGVAFGDSGVDIRFDPPSRAARVVIGLEGGSSFEVEWRRGHRVLASDRIEIPRGIPAEGTVAVEVPDAAREEFDRMRVLPLRGEGSYRLTKLCCATAPNSITMLRGQPTTTRRSSPGRP